MKDLQDAVFKLSEDISPKRVHHLRTTIRRMESLTGYLHPKLSGKQQKTMEELAELRKRAGKVRDIDIQMGMLGAIGNGSTAADRRVLAGLMKAKRTRQDHRLSSLLKKLDSSKFLARVEKIVEEIEVEVDAPPINEKPFLPLQQAKSELAKLAAAFSVNHSLRPHRLHGLRIDLKRIRYTAELAADSPEQESFLQSIKSVQDAIGEWHDWETLLKTTEKQFGGRLNCALLVEMRSLFATRYSTAKSAVGRLLAPTPVAKKQPRSDSSPAIRTQQA